MSDELTIRVAVESLASEPPDWLRAEVVAADVLMIETATNPRRKRELVWSRGLKASLVACMPATLASDSPPQFSISHDRYFTAVGMSQYGSIGIDLQTDYPLESCCRIADAWFPEAESREILEAEDCGRFLCSWVLKEAWAKCMKRSIFESCRRIALWQGQVHLVDEAADVPQFACARQYFAVNKHLADESPGLVYNGTNSKDHTAFTIGVCLQGKVPNAPSIECLIPVSNSAANSAAKSKLHRLEAHWEWISVAGK